MVCTCGERIPHHALKCQKCQKKTGNTPMHDDLPIRDMYGDPVSALSINKQKATERSYLLYNIPSYKKNRINLNNRMCFLTRMLPSILVFLFVIVIFLLPKEYIMNDVLTEAVLGVGEFVMIIIGMILFAVTKPKGSKLQRHRQASLHDNKDKYYISKNVIGYAKHYDEDFNGSKEENKRYSFLEIDKQNIKSIAYDPIYKEYVFLLHKPVYEDYDLKPARIFRIQDVFENGYLEKAMGMDFPDELPMY